MSIGAPIRGGVAAGLTLVVLMATLAARQPSSKVPVRPAPRGYSAGPVALSLRQPSEAMVLQADGRVFTLNTARGAIGSQFYRIPAGYQAVDMSAGTGSAGPIVCFTLNKSSSKDYGSFVLQILPDRREIWNWLSTGGVYVGLALDAAAGQAYVGNSTTNAIYRVPIGSKDVRAQQIAIVGDAERIGAMAIDPAGGRLFVADMGADRVYVVSLAGQRKPRAIALYGIEEVRAITWDARTRRIYAADSAEETIWAIDPELSSSKPQRILTDRRVKDPSGLALADDGTLWVADEVARMLFQVSVGTRAILRTVAWDPPSARQ